MWAETALIRGSQTHPSVGNPQHLGRDQLLVFWSQVLMGRTRAAWKEMVRDGLCQFQFIIRDGPSVTCFSKRTQCQFTSTVNSKSTLVGEEVGSHWKFWEKCIQESFKPMIYTSVELLTQVLSGLGYTRLQNRLPRIGSRYQFLKEMLEKSSSVLIKRHQNMLSDTEPAAWVFFVSGCPWSIVFSCILMYFSNIFLI